MQELAHIQAGIAFKHEPCVLLFYVLLGGYGFKKRSLQKAGSSLLLDGHERMVRNLDYDEGLIADRKSLDSFRRRYIGNL